MMTSQVSEPASLHTFDGLAEDVVQVCLSFSAPMRARRGDVITRQGDPARTLYVIRSGYAKVASTSRAGHEVIVGFAGPLDVFGHMAAMEYGEKYLASATALNAMELASWTRQDALNLSERFPEVHARLDAQMGRNLSVTLERLHTVSEGKVQPRLARALLELAARHGERHNDTIRLLPPLSRQDLAAVTGTTLYTVSRTLAAWQHEGMIRSARARISILRPEQLRRVAGLVGR
jgi:CRP/FNR family transcriptional regulator, nitrogen oxide reductase regulator